MAKSAIEMIGVNKWFGDFHVHKDINLTVASGQHVVICGPLDRVNPPSCAVSTGLRCINRARSASTEWT
ncbi:hypothetical protein IMCC21224_112656 [Puniceibacterium sp. IMCC21224]|nr:hypothetical protein IMCC21224_112656 [Puniceibacterium sp. IMCC21224]